MDFPQRFHQQSFCIHTLEIIVQYGSLYSVTKYRNDCEKIITLRKPLEVKYLAQFRYECNYLGFKCEIGNGYIEDMYYRNNYI